MEMSAKERERAHVIRQVSERGMRQRRAAELLGIGVRQVKRLISAYRGFGDHGVVSGRRGKPSNNRLAVATVASMERGSAGAIRRLRSNLGGGEALRA